MAGLCLAARHESSPEKDFGALLAEVKELAGVPPAAAYQYRHQMGWDNTWMDLDESQLEHVLKHGHIVERRRVSGGWEPYTGGRVVPEPEFGMFPIDAMAQRPDTAHAERIFAASRDLYDAWDRDESWAVEMPLHEAYVLFFLETVNDAITAMNRRWDEAGRPGALSGFACRAGRAAENRLPRRQPGCIRFLGPGGLDGEDSGHRPARQPPHSDYLELDGLGRVCRHRLDLWDRRRLGRALGWQRWPRSTIGPSKR